MSNFDDPVVQLNLMYYQHAERAEVLIEQFEALNRLMIEAHVFREGMVFGPIMDPTQAGPPWKLSVDVAVQMVADLSVGIGIVTWTKQDHREYQSQPERLYTSAKERFQRFHDCDLAIRVRFVNQFDGLIELLHALLRQVTSTSENHPPVSPG